LRDQAVFRFSSDASRASESSVGWARLAPPSGGVPPQMGTVCRRGAWRVERRAMHLSLDVLLLSRSLESRRSADGAVFVANLQATIWQQEKVLTEV
jgi:hypothetical protein